MPSIHVLRNVFSEIYEFGLSTKPLEIWIAESKGGVRKLTESSEIAVLRMRSNSVKQATAILLRRRAAFKLQCIAIAIFLLLSMSAVQFFSVPGCIRVNVL